MNKKGVSKGRCCKDVVSTRWEVTVRLRKSPTPFHHSESYEVTRLSNIAWLVATVGALLLGFLR